MMIEIGQVEAIFRYPVKSMGGERLEAANLGWHGLEGDRRLALRRIEERSGFPWLTATKLPELLLFRPQRREDGDPGNIPTHIRMPDGRGTPVFGEELAAEVGRRWGAPVEMMQLRHGVFDDACISVIAADTVGWLNGKVIGKPEDEADARRIIKSLSGTVHELWTGVCLWLRPGDWQVTWQELSLVRMKLLSDAEVDAYLKTRKWEGCSGAYAIELPHDPYLSVEQGSESNVIGLPMESLEKMLKWLAITAQS